MFIPRFTVDDQIQLRLLRQQDAEQHYALLDANRAYVGAYEAWALNATQGSQQSYIRHKLEQYIGGRGFTAGIWYRIDTAAEYALAGNISYETSFSNQSGEIGYWLAEAFTGKGIITRAVRAVVQYALTEGEMNRVVIMVAEDNAASRAVAERLGFHLDGVLRHETVYDGQFRNRAVYTMLADEIAKLQVTDSPSSKEG